MLAYGMGPPRSAADVLGAAGEGRQNRDHVARLERRLELPEVADILVVQVDVDEAVQPAILALHLAQEARILLIQVLQELFHGGALAADRLLASGQPLQRGGHLYFNGHGLTPAGRPRRGAQRAAVCFSLPRTDRSPGAADHRRTPRSRSARGWSGCRRRAGTSGRGAS